MKITEKLMGALGMLLVLVIVISSLTLSHKAIKVTNVVLPQREATTSLEAPKVFKPYYIRVAMMYEGMVHRRLMMKKEMLDKYDVTFIGRSMVLGHEKSDPNMVVGRIIAADLRYDKKLKKYYMQGIVKVLSEDAVKKIKLGLYYHVSISWAILDRRGQEVTVMEGIELSIVGAAASRHARIMKLSQEKLELTKREF